MAHSRLGYTSVEYTVVGLVLPVLRILLLMISKVNGRFI